MTLDPFNSSLDTVLAFFHGQVTFRRNLGESSRKIKGTEILPYLKLFDYRKGDLTRRGPRGFSGDTDLAKSVFNSCNVSSKQG